jgi:hypothetical protein
MDHIWKAWKQDNLGDSNIIVHEPDVRHRSSGFRGTSREHAASIVERLDDVLAELDFRIIATVVDLREFEVQYPEAMVDDFLPVSCYLMSIDFVLERFLHFLQQQVSGARGLVVAESRGLREDAQVHAEFMRLQLEGTQFIPDSSFRAYLRPYIEFYRKSQNNTGLQIADLAARPMAEKILDPAARPTRWEVFARKLYDGETGAPHKYGFKVFPLVDGNDPFPDLLR